MLVRDRAQERRAVTRVLTAGGAILSAILIAQLCFGIRASDLMRDAADVASAGSPPYAGLISYVGIGLWLLTAAVCVAAALQLGGAGPALPRRFLLTSGALSLVLGLDDLFQIHEGLAPRVVGVPEQAVIALYALLTLAHLLRSRALILRTHVMLLGIALGFFAVSVAIDTLPVLLFDRSATIDEVPPAILDAFVFAEDGAKLIGILAWHGYFIDVARRLLRAAEPSGLLAAHRAA